MARESATRLNTASKEGQFPEVPLFVGHSHLNGQVGHPLLPFWKRVPADCNPGVGNLPFCPKTRWIRGRVQFLFKTQNALTTRTKRSPGGDWSEEMVSSSSSTHRDLPDLS